MIIRKEFKFEGAHIVRNCSSTRCSKSIHGHSYRVEVKLKSNKLDAGGMVVDFGLLSGGVIGDFIDSFDHSWTAWSKESDAFLQAVSNLSDRFVLMPVSPSAENYALMFLDGIRHLIGKTEFSNEEGVVQVSSVRVHETVTGWAEAFPEDLPSMYPYGVEHLYFSDGVRSDWKYYDMFGTESVFVNKRPERQI